MASVLMKLGIGFSFCLSLNVWGPTHANHSSRWKHSSEWNRQKSLEIKQWIKLIKIRRGVEEENKEINKKICSVLDGNKCYGETKVRMREREYQKGWKTVDNFKYGGHGRPHCEGVTWTPGPGKGESHGDLRQKYKGAVVASSLAYSEDHGDQWQEWSKPRGE